MSPADFSAPAGQQDSRDDGCARTVDHLPYQLTTSATGGNSWHGSGCSHAFEGRCPPLVSALGWKSAPYPRFELEFVGSPR